jgi:hypothetical protein
MSECRPVLADPVPGHMYVDATPNGEVVFTNISQDDSLASTVVYMTPRTASKLGQWLIDVATRLETP